MFPARPLLDPLDCPNQSSSSLPGGFAIATPPTVTVRIQEALRYAQARAAQVGRTQQLELADDLYIRIAPGGRKFLLFGLADEPERAQAQAVAQVLGLQNPRYGWHQGETLRSLTVEEEDA